MIVVVEKRGNVGGAFDEALDPAVVGAHVYRLGKRPKERLRFDPTESQGFLGYRLIDENEPCSMTRIDGMPSGQVRGAYETGF